MYKQTAPPLGRLFNILIKYNLLFINFLKVALSNEDVPKNPLKADNDQRDEISDDDNDDDDDAAMHVPGVRNVYRWRCTACINVTKGCSGTFSTSFCSGYTWHTLSTV